MDKLVKLVQREKQDQVEDRAHLARKVPLELLDQRIGPRVQTEDCMLKSGVPDADVTTSDICLDSSGCSDRTNGRGWRKQLAQCCGLAVLVN